MASSPAADFRSGRLQRFHEVSASTGVPFGTTEFDKLYVEHLAQSLVGQGRLGQVDTSPEESFVGSSPAVAIGYFISVG